MNEKVSAIVVAAGSGTRMGFDKVFYPLKGKETLLYSVEAMEKNPGIDEIILVVAEQNLQRAEALCRNKFKKLCKITCGGDTRTKSVVNGISFATGDYLVIHDGARPLVSQNIITNCIEEVKKYNAVTVSLPVTDTIKRFKGDFIEETVDRESLVSVQTPQCFKKELYLECLEKQKGRNFTDDCALFESCGIDVKLIKGESRNIKLTRKADIFMALSLMEEEGLCE